MSRYSRQIILPEVGVTGQGAFARAHVLVVGAGGLAAAALPLLAGAGIGQLTIVDGDVVDKSNLHRQHLFAESDCGKPKAEIAAVKCRSLNGDIAVHARAQNLTPANVRELIEPVDIVVDCADSYAVSYTLSDACQPNSIPLISASALGLSGYVGGFCGGAPSLRALFAQAPRNSASCATAGVLGPVVCAMGAFQAQMVLAHILGLKPAPLGQLVRFDAKTFRSSSFRFDAAEEPASSFRFVSIGSLTPSDTIIELRDDQEAPDPLHPLAIRLAPCAIDTYEPQDGRRLALCCATGLRAWRAAEKIHEIWPGEIVLVAASAS